MTEAEEGEECAALLEEALAVDPRAVQGAQTRRTLAEEDGVFLVAHHQHPLLLDVGYADHGAVVGVVGEQRGGALSGETEAVDVSSVAANNDVICSSEAHDFGMPFQLQHNLHDWRWGLEGKGGGGGGQAGLLTGYKASKSPPLLTFICRLYFFLIA